MENQSEEIGDEENLEGVLGSESQAGDEGKSNILSFGSDVVELVDSDTGFGILVGGEDEVSDEDLCREEEKGYREEMGDEEREDKEEEEIFTEDKEVEEYDMEHGDDKEGDCEEEEEEAEEEEELEKEKESMDLVYDSVEQGNEITMRIKSENDLSKIPSEIYGDRNLMESLLRDLSKERPSIILRNKYLEYKCSKHLNSTRGAVVSSSIETNAGFEEEEETERERYMRFLSRYKKESDENRIRNESIKESVDYLRDELNALVATDAEVFADLISIETSLGVDLVFEKTGRRISVKRVEEMIGRQKSRRNQLARARLSFIRLWHKFEEIDKKIRKFETLGPGMRISDYEAEMGVNLISKTRIDERNKALQKARERVCGIMAAITHGKVKLCHLDDEIVFKKANLDRISKCVHARRETLSAMRGELTITRNRCSNKRETAGLLLSLPTLRAIEDIMELHTEWKNRVEDLRSVQVPDTVIKKKKRC